MSDLETALRDMLHERAGDITTLPPRLIHLDQLPDIDTTELLDLAAPYRPARTSRWLLAAAVALIIVIAGAVVGIRQLGDHPQPATPNTVTPTSTPTTPPTSPPTSPSPTPTTSTTANAADVPLACKATLPHAWKAALSSQPSAYGAQSASPVQVLSNGDILVARDFGHGQPRDLAIVGTGHPPRSIFQVTDPDTYDVQSASIHGKWLVAGVGLSPRSRKGEVQGSLPTPNVEQLYVVDLNSGARKRIANNPLRAGPAGGRTTQMATVLDGKIYWDVKPSYGSTHGVIKSYDLATGAAQTAYSGPPDYIAGSVAGLGSNLNPHTVYVHAPLPKMVKENLSPDHPLSVATDGTAYAWEIAPREIAWWTPGRSKPVYLRLHAKLEETDPAMLVVSGRFVMPGQNEVIVDMTTGAETAYKPAPKSDPVLTSYGSTVAGVDSVGTGHWQDGYWFDPQPQVARLDPSTLPGLHC